MTSHAYNLSANVSGFYDVSDNFAKNCEEIGRRCIIAKIWGSKAKAVIIHGMSCSVNARIRGIGKDGVEIDGKESEHKYRFSCDCFRFLWDLSMIMFV